MNRFSTFAGSMAAVALVLAAASPASARDDWRWRRHDRGVDAGAVFGLLLGVGVIAAIASANSNRAQRADTARADPPRYDDRAGDSQSGDYRADDGRYDDRSYDNGAPPQNGQSGGQSGGLASANEDDAVDACAVAARDEVSRSGGFADIRQITGVTPRGSGWDVTGTVDQRTSYSAREARQRSFRCAFDNGQVTGVTFGTSV